MVQQVQSLHPPGKAGRRGSWDASPGGEIREGPSLGPVRPKPACPLIRGEAGASPKPWQRPHTPAPRLLAPLPDGDLRDPASAHGSAPTSPAEAQGKGSASGLGGGEDRFGMSSGHGLTSHDGP